MSKNGRFFCTAMAAAIFCSAPVSADFNTNGEKGVVRTMSAQTIGPGKLTIGTGISIFQSMAYVNDVYNQQGQAINVADTNRDFARMLSSNLFLGMGITRFWDIAMALPFYYDWLGFDQISDGGIGDLEISTKFLYPPMSNRLFYQAYYLSSTFPVGMRNSGFFPRNPYYIEGNDTNPARSFYSSEYVTIKGMMLWTFDIGAVAARVPVQVHLNFGGVISTSMQHQRNTAILSLALEYTPADLVSLFVDFHGESRWTTLSTSLDPSNDPLLLSPGIKLTTASGLYLSLVSDISLSSRAQSTRLHWHPADGPAQGYHFSTGILPNYGIQFVLGWNGRIATPENKKPVVVNYDRDNDGIPDSLDKCPDSPEDRDGFQDEDGCPDYDNDQDGIPDSLDKCPDFREDYDGFQDIDGCPDYDNDHDGIPDSLDKCPNEPEDIDGFQDNDGCPDYDNDQDGVPDTLDKCPNVPGIAANQGCPPDTTKPAKKEIDFPRSQILTGLNFRKGTAELTFESYQFLEPIIQKLKNYPEVEIELHGHTDGIGDYMRNMQLSQMRAEAIRQYFISKGIAAERIRAVGFGSSSPIANNKTAAGRAQNRRVEMVRVK
ncbi:MAG: OmpA family protein [Chitinispirillaceae bacterium]|jgi:outer membrane protein OmpA-like peptidoglycan-associated protein